MSLFNFSPPAFLLVPSTEKYERKWNRLSRLYARYHEIQKSDHFLRYEDLNRFVSSPEYHQEIMQIRSMNYQGSKEQLAERRLADLKKYPEVKEYRKTGEMGSGYVQEYMDLQEHVHSPSFKKHKAFLLNRRRHLTSDSYQKQVEYKRLSKSRDIKEYFSLQKKYRTLFSELEGLKPLFEDEFRSLGIAPHWSVNSPQSIHTFQQIYSQSEELSCITQGTNIEQRNGVFRIYTRHEDANGMAWDQKFGFVPCEYQYTSGLVSTAENLQIERGSIEIKLRFTNVKNVYHSLWLGGAERLPFLSGFTYCNKSLLMGAYTQDKKAYVKQKKIALSDDQFYVLNIEITNGAITWYINGKKMAECANILKTPMSIGLSSGIIGATDQMKLPAVFEIDWIRVYNNPVIKIRKS